MSWLALDDLFAEHPKVARLSDRAFRAHVSAMCWAARHKTGGAIPKGVLRMLIPRAQKAILRELTVDPGLGKSPLWRATEDGYEIHDWEGYNSTAEEAQERAETLADKRRAAGKAGAKARWAAREAAAAPDLPSSLPMPNAWQTDGKKCPPSPSQAPSPENSTPQSPSKDLASGWQADSKPLANGDGKPMAKSEFAIAPPGLVCEGETPENIGDPSPGGPPATPDQVPKSRQVPRGTDRDLDHGLAQRRDAKLDETKRENTIASHRASHQDPIDPEAKPKRDPARARAVDRMAWMGADQCEPVQWAFRQWVEAFGLPPDTQRTHYRMTALMERYRETIDAGRDWEADFKAALQAGLASDFVARECRGELARIVGKREDWERFRAGPPKAKPRRATSPQPGGSLADFSYYTYDTEGNRVEVRAGEETY